MRTDNNPRIEPPPLGAAWSESIAESPCPGLSGDRDTSLSWGKDGQRPAAIAPSAPRHGAPPGHSAIAHAAEAPWHIGPGKCTSEIRSAPTAQTLASAPWPNSTVPAQRTGTGLQMRHGLPPWAHSSNNMPSTAAHMVGWWILRGVGPPSHAPVPRHFHGHQRPMRMRAKSSDFPAAIEHLGSLAGSGSGLEPVAPPRSG